MSDTGVRELVLRFYEAFNEGDVSAALSAFSADLEISDPAIGTVRGVVPFRDYLESFNRAVPDRQIITERLDEADDSVFVEGHFVGTHTGPVIGPGGATIQPTGASIRARENSRLSGREFASSSRNGRSSAWSLTAFRSSIRSACSHSIAAPVAVGQADSISAR